ncbi:hypothetical protein DSO57_1000222 [Entomophthora muscae]|uniref:Uncharacterized protein n=1 Tax=Entomophthora muscae TaxID=34485 RepID=A0ACC2U918_9FUNG|nr:hypothetical protein DSO57_1000222 [Entomophthora muscae]
MPPCHPQVHAALQPNSQDLLLLSLHLQTLWTPHPCYYVLLVLCLVLYIVPATL